MAERFDTPPALVFPLMLTLALLVERKDFSLSPPSLLKRAVPLMLGMILLHLDFIDVYDGRLLLKRCWC